ncbi:MAG: FtsX-like permease family protein, partial [Pirellulales bacterium]
NMQREADKELARLEDETRKIMLKLGFNLRIVHKDTDLTRLRTEFVAADMPEEYVERLANAPELTKIAHLVATLQQLVTWEGRRRLLVGYAPEASQPNAPEKKPIGLTIEPGTVVLGHEAGIGHKVDEKIELLGREFRVASILSPRDSADDVMIAMNLRDAQQLLGKPGKITEILAVNCRCQSVDRLGEIRPQLEKVLPQAKITESESKAVARAEQREIVRQLHKGAIANHAQQRRNSESALARLYRAVMPIAVLAAAIWVGFSSWSNVRERRSEIGLLRAIGKKALSIAGLFLGKAVLLGLLGGIIGAACGFALAVLLADTVLNAPAAEVPVNWPLIMIAALAAPLIALAASYVPTLAAVVQDPSIVLRDV